MKLLVVTQAVDENDPVLGFFCRWLEEFAKHAERIDTICLREGPHTLPANVCVHSLGGEHGRRSSTITAVRFKWLAWKLRADYDAVFVHMNPEYILVAGPLWRLLGKQVTFWYNHPHGGWKMRLAARLAETVFYTSPHAASARLPNAVRMPAGIDTSLFAPASTLRNRHSLYLQGRIASSKRVHIALEALRILRTHIPAILTIVGPEDASYGRELRTRFADLIKDGSVTFSGPRRNVETPALYATHGAAVNLAAAGHFDKTVLEAMACETPVVVGSKGFEGLIPDEWVVPQDDAKALAAALEKLLLLSDEEYRTLGSAERAAVIATQGLPLLAEKLQRVYA